MNQLIIPTDRLQYLADPLQTPLWVQWKVPIECQLSAGVPAVSANIVPLFAHSPRFDVVPWWKSKKEPPTSRNHDRSYDQPQPDTLETDRDMQGHAKRISPPM